MGIVIGYTVDSQENIKQLLNAKDYYEAERELGLYHEYQGISFQRWSYDFGSGMKGWAPMFMLLHLSVPSNTTAYFFDEKNWLPETSTHPRMLHLTRDLMLELWGTLRSISIDSLEGHAKAFCEEIKKLDSLYHAWKIERFETILDEYLELFRACQSAARWEGFEMIITME